MSLGSLGNLFRRRWDAWPDDADSDTVRRLKALGETSADVEARVTRSRAFVREEFIRQRASRDVRTWRPIRRLAVAMVTASLAAALAMGGVLASDAGEPFYDVRLAVEELFLPAEATARTEAQLDRLDQRLDEVAAAFDTDNADAARAALQAYGRIAGEVAGSEAPASVRQTATLRVTAQLRRLQGLLAEHPSGAGDEALRDGRGLLGRFRGGAPTPGVVPGGSVAPVPTPEPWPSPSAGGGRSPDPSSGGHGQPSPSPGGSNGSGQSPRPHGSGGADGTGEAEPRR